MYRNVIAAAVLAGSFLSSAIAQDIKIDIPYQKFVLPNGLTLLVHEDRKAPIVAVNIWYHVGSKNETKGKTGFAHLFEHLMFNGSENFNQDYFKVLEKLGATSLNGTTNEDRTNYFQNVPTSALDTVLWMESDRMGHLLGAVDQKKLDEQRGVVQNEKRQGENQPYGLVWTLIPENAFPEGHPYSWSPIGSMEDLNAASLTDVQEWFKRYYGPSNAVIVLAGDIDAKTAKEKVERYFGHIPPGPPVAKHREWIAKREGSKRVLLQDRVPQARIYKIWNVPPTFRTETNYLHLAAGVLGQGKTSRLYKRLVYDDQIATDVSASVEGLEIAGLFMITATARPGEDLGRVEKAIEEEMQKFLAEGPTPDELKRVQVQYVANLVRGSERIGGFGGKSDILAQGEIYAGNPEAYKKNLEEVQGATTEDLKRVANTWLSDGVLDLEVQPFPNFKPSSPDVDRSKVPEAGPVSDAKFPELQRATLSNGMKIILAERHEAPLVNLAMAFDAGYAADQFGVPGTAKLAMAMLDEGTKTRNALEISRQLDTLGARLNAGSNLDTSFLSLSVLKVNLDPALDIFADVILNPSFPQADFAREQKQLLAAIQREKVQPMTMGLRLLPSFIYGDDHAYSNPLTGSGTEESVASLTREALIKFHQTWMHPNNATLVVVGDTTLAEIQPKIEKAFQNWKKAEVPKKNLAQVKHRETPVLYLMDRPGSMQSTIIAGHIAPPRANPDEIALETLNTVLGGNFTSRLNMNLREDKHWSYGAGSFLYPARGQRTFMVYSPVQTDKTKEAVAEVNRELQEILQKRPVTGEELAMAQDSQTLRLPGSRETTGALLGDILELVQYNLPDDYFDTYAEKVRALDSKDMAAAAEKLIHPDKLVWVIVGDRAKIEPGLKELSIGDVHLIDADGDPVR